MDVVIAFLLGLVMGGLGGVSTVAVLWMMMKGDDDDGGKTV